MPLKKGSMWRLNPSGGGQPTGVVYCKQLGDELWVSVQCMWPTGRRPRRASAPALPNARHLRFRAGMEEGGL